jgi:hypothetical protein
MRSIASASKKMCSDLTFVISAMRNVQPQMLAINLSYLMISSNFFDIKLVDAL